MSPAIALLLSALAHAAPPLPLALDVEYCFGACSESWRFSATLHDDGTFDTVNEYGMRFDGVWRVLPRSGAVELAFDMEDYGIGLVYRGRRAGRCLEGAIRQTNLESLEVTEGEWRGCVD